ncbi:1-deoxy-D-xylulose 5-phosphate reductoisomerase [Tepiditoga spiralis]|uniref:1-deoxy-D-xylulose 5-phosphate reductoisomerase n=1 Tax=Tepiditoga spiralis TaxID=2108365 RepID=A0A7G1G7N6_9BACT|nr:1-deoxy-D-xylulose-5-phosphate reductoisomerase [Tepiditoga spiralis]BBE31386.1 1-deoxy-D-xylulose 5-phosphate reductoisomerase [Tepiditoga spiralis]
MKKIFITGITGSIGIQTLDVVRTLKNFEIVGGSIYSNWEKLKKIIDEFHLKYVAVVKDGEFPKEYNGCKVLVGKRSVERAIELSSPDITIVATSGASGIKHTIQAIKSSKRIGLANKESIVCGGNLVLDLAKKFNTEIIPVDSEHSAIYQLLLGEKEVEKIILTASGGALRDYPVEKLKAVKPSEVLKHPNWNMGKRITVDSATMLNKGLEIIEAYYLFKTKNIEAFINRNSHIHSMVKFKDGVIKMHFGTPTMKIPIAYSLTYPERIYKFDIPNLFDEKIEFEKIDFQRYTLIKTAYEILGNQKLHIAYNAADEVFVELFLNEKISFLEINKGISETLSKIEKENIKISSFEDVFKIDELSRNIAKELGGNY